MVLLVALGMEIQNPLEGTSLIPPTHMVQLTARQNFHVMPLLLVAVCFFCGTQEGQENGVVNI